MLLQLDALQRFEDFGLSGLFNELARAAVALREDLTELHDYIAPCRTGVVREYRGGRVYLRLVATERIFAEAMGQQLGAASPRGPPLEQPLAGHGPGTAAGEAAIEQPPHLLGSPTSGDDLATRTTERRGQQ